MYRIFLIVIISCSLLGCGTVKKLKTSFTGEDNSTPPTPLTKISQRLSVQELWSKNVGDGSDEKYLKLTPAVESERVYIAENGGDLLALDSNTGKVIWDVDTNKPISGGPGASSSGVFVGTQEGEVVAFDPISGEQLWQTQLTSEVLSRPAASNGIVVARTIDGKVFGLDEKSGKRIWIYNRKVPSLTLRGTSNPLIDSGLVFTGFDGGRLAAIELGTGKLIWETKVAQARGGNELDRMVDIDAELIIDAGTIFVTTFQGNVAAVDSESGRIQWLREISSFAGLAVSDEYVFVSDEESNLWALDRFTGDSIWKQEKLLARALTAPVVHDDYVVVADLEGYLHWINSMTGEIIARSQVNESRIITAPLVDNGKLYAYAVDGTMKAYTYQGAVLPSQENSAEELSDNEIDEEILQSSSEQDIADSYDEDVEAEEDDGLSFGKILDIFTFDDEDDSDDTD